MAKYSSFILGFLCYYWLSFHSHESSLHKVFTWFLLIVCFCFLFRLCLLVFSFALYFCWMVRILDFYWWGFPSSLSRSRTTIAHHIPMWNGLGVESTFTPWNDLKKCTMPPMPSCFVWPTGCMPRKQAGRRTDHTGALCSLCQIMPWQLGHYNTNLGICTRCTWYNALLLPVHTLSRKKRNELSFSVSRSCTNQYCFWDCCWDHLIAAEMREIVLNLIFADVMYFSTESCISFG